MAYKGGGNTSGRDEALGRPRVMLVSAWVDPTQPHVWSGATSQVIAELERLGVYAGVRDSTPWVPAGRAIRRWLEWRGRMGPAWTLTREMRALSTLSGVFYRALTPRGIDGWIVPAMGVSRSVRGRVVTWTDMSPAQIESAGRDWPTMGYQASPPQLAMVARWQEAEHRHAHACCVASRWVRDSLVRDHGIDAERIRVVGVGRNVSIEAPEDRDWTVPRFLFVGRDWKRKNGDAVVRSFTRLREEIPDATLDIVGNHPPLAGDGVVGHGPLSFSSSVERPELEAAFARATCFVMPSFVEPFGMVYVEAGAAGLPSIGTIHGGTEDSIGPGGILVDPTDDVAIYNAMRRLSEPATARRLGSIAQQHSEQFTWAKTAERLLRAFEFPNVDQSQLAEFL